MNMKKKMTVSQSVQSWALFSELRIAVADCVTFEAVSAICIPYFKYNGRAANAIRIFESKKFMSSASAICFSKFELILGENVGLFYCVATQKHFFPAVFFKKTVVFCNCIPYLWDIIFGETAICFRNWNRARPTAPAICIYETGHKKPKVTAICFFETATCAQL